jgi:hypothetical protein
VPVARRRQVHEAIADTLPDGPRSRRHRALATVGPDDVHAAELEHDADRRPAAPSYAAGLGPTHIPGSTRTSSSCGCDQDQRGLDPVAVSRVRGHAGLRSSALEAIASRP